MKDNEVVLSLLLSRIVRVDDVRALKRAQVAVAREFYSATGRCIVRMRIECDAKGNIVAVDCETQERKGDVVLTQSHVSRTWRTLH